VLTRVRLAGNSFRQAACPFSTSGLRISASRWRLRYFSYALTFRRDSFIIRARPAGSTDRRTQAVSTGSTPAARLADMANAFRLRLAPRRSVPVPSRAFLLFADHREPVYVVTVAIEGEVDRDDVGLIKPGVAKSSPHYSAAGRRNIQLDSVHEPTCLSTLRNVEQHGFRALVVTSDRARRSSPCVYLR
jgi:hypothetical protein